ncbi:MAG: hypothetical protein O7D91_08130 [Planctomycetota bacterium]|nr:hypothetical protein [Planctomycetota bacterium]
MGLIEREASRLDGTGKGVPILIENITSAAAKSIADEERRTQERARADAKSQATCAKLDRLAAANASAKGLIETLSGDQLADLHRQVLQSCPLLKRESWERADPRAHPDLMREIARVARKSTRKVSA